MIGQRSSLKENLKYIYRTENVKYIPRSEYKLKYISKYVGGNESSAKGKFYSTKMFTLGKRKVLESII